MLKAPEIREKVFAKFEDKISGILTPEDQIITKGYDESGYLFYFLTDCALFVFECRFPSQIGNINAIESFYVPQGGYGSPIKVIVEDVLNDLVQVYQTNGSHQPQSHHSQVSLCFLFPKITKNLTSNEISLCFSNIYKTPQHLNTKAPVLQESLKSLRKQKLAELKRIQENNCLGVIKELLLELEPNDEAKLEIAMKVVKEEIPLSKINDTFIENALREVAQKLPEFKYIRLTKSIRRKDITSEQLEKDIDKLFKKFDDKNKL